MSEMTLTNDEKRCLQMWFRQAIVEVERREALHNIIAFYGNGEPKTRQGHHNPVSRRAGTRRPQPAHSKELV
jgi:hypothetical protein